MNATVPGAIPGFAFGAYRLFTTERRLEKHGSTVQLGSRAFDLLVALAEKSGEVVGKNELISRAWPDLTVDESNLRFHIVGLRKALEDGRDGTRYITNVPGRGYCLAASATPIVPDDGAAPALSSSFGQSHGLPHRLDRMVGRDDMVRRICAEIASHRFVTIHGPGGIGKTTVAAAVAHELLNAFGGAVHFLDLAPIEDAADIAGTLATALGLPDESQDPMAEIVETLRSRRLLIIIDCCEHLVEESAAIAERIYLEAPDVGLLVTSREHLRAEGEHVCALPPLDWPVADADVTASRMQDFAATRLFVERVRSSGYAAPFTDADARCIVDICRKLDGIALAIELAASRAASHGFNDTAALIDSRLQLVWRGKRTALPRHQTLKAMIDWSFERLSGRERAVMRHLSIFGGPFLCAAAQAVLADDEIGATEIAEDLESLVAKSLVAVQIMDGVTQYRLLDTTREYARIKLIEAGEHQHYCERHAEHTLRAFKQAETPVPADRPAAAAMLASKADAC